MVKIIKIEQRLTEDGRAFTALILQGGIEMIQSKTTGNFYATARKASIASTFDEQTANSLIGSEIPGSIEKVKCDPYEYIDQESGEVLTLEHRYVYVPESANSKTPLMREQHLKADVKAFSTNGTLQPA